MASTKLLSHWDQLFFSGFHNVRTQGEWVFPCETEAEAKNLRGQFYAFRDSLYEDPDAPPELAAIAPQVRFTITLVDVDVRWKPVRPWLLHLFLENL